MSDPTHSGAFLLDRVRLASKGGGTASDILNFLASPAALTDLKRLISERDELIGKLLVKNQEIAAAATHMLLAGVSIEPTPEEKTG